LESLLTEFLLLRLKDDPEFAKSVACQLLNVLKHCDQITYEEPGTAEAYRERGTLLGFKVLRLTGAG